MLTQRLQPVATRIVILGGSTFILANIFSIRLLASERFLPALRISGTEKSLSWNVVMHALASLEVDAGPALSTMACGERSTRIDGFATHTQDPQG